MAGTARLAVLVGAASNNAQGMVHVGVHARHCMHVWAVHRLRVSADMCVCTGRTLVWVACWVLTYHVCMCVHRVHAWGSAHRLCCMHACRCVSVLTVCVLCTHQAVCRCLGLQEALERGTMAPVKYLGG